MVKREAGGESARDEFVAHLGSDAPARDPSEDAYGYVPFASHVARAVRTTPSPQGLVMAIHGEWGAGKSSLANFIKHCLRSEPEALRPAIIDFNPWWFEGRDHLASQFLAQFGAQLPDGLADVRKLADLLAKYSKAVSSAAATASGHPWVGTALAAAIDFFKSRPKSIPRLKGEISAALAKANRRFVFFVDDIDRLTPQEAREFFQAVKALADFPNVVYVLFFDRGVVARLLSSEAMDGEAYLEKIVQAPFSLPAVDRGLLQAKLFGDLDALLEALPRSRELDRSRWAQIFSNGVDGYLRRPRDVVRIVNALSLTYPPVAGEVNVADFIALEFLRVFEPVVYSEIRDNKFAFAGQGGSVSPKDEREKQFHAAWTQAIDDPKRRETATRIVSRLFPKVAAILGVGGGHSSALPEWRRELRVCSEELFHVYFHFGVPAGHLSRSMIDALLALPDSTSMAHALDEVGTKQLADGSSKAIELVTRLTDLTDEIETGTCSHLLEALFDAGDRIVGKDSAPSGFFALPKEWRVHLLATALLSKVPVEERVRRLSVLFDKGRALHLIASFAHSARKAKEDPSRAESAFQELAEGAPDELAAAATRRFEMASVEDLLTTPSLVFVLFHWAQWGGADAMRQKFSDTVADDAGLLRLLSASASVGTASTGNKSWNTYRVSQASLDPILDAGSVEARVQALASRSNLSELERGACVAYLRNLEARRAGKDPDAFHGD